jgi:glycosyltransferase involved in cell wall biosynthesis
VTLRDPDSSPATPARRPLYVFSPWPPQRNGLADYMLEYLPLLARDHALFLVAESGSASAVRSRFALQPYVQVLDEVEFLARQPDPSGQILYNIGNNGDCAYILDHAHRFPGVTIVHDVSLFYLHQEAARRAHMNPLMGSWLVDDRFQVPDDFLNRDGSLNRTPGLLYQECLMLRRLLAASTGVMVHTAYAERRLRGNALDVALGHAAGRPLARIPHFVLQPSELLAPEQVVAMLERFEIRDDDFLLLVPGFLTGNKMLYEILVAYQAASQQVSGLRLVFAGEERAQEYALSRRIEQLWPLGPRPLVTGYLDADELDVLLGRADLSFVLRFPTYGESSGILPRAAMGGGEVITVDIGAYPEFQSPAVHHVSVGRRTVDELTAGILQAYARRSPLSERTHRRAAESARAAVLSPQALYQQLKQLLDDSWVAPT